MAAYMAAVGALVIAAAHVLVAAGGRPARLGRQFASAMAVTVGLVTLGVGVVAR